MGLNNCSQSIAWWKIKGRWSERIPCLLAQAQASRASWGWKGLFGWPWPERHSPRWFSRLIPDVPYRTGITLKPCCPFLGHTLLDDREKLERQYETDQVCIPWPSQKFAVSALCSICNWTKMTSFWKTEIHDQTLNGNLISSGENVRSSKSPLTGRPSVFSGYAFWIGINVVGVLEHWNRKCTCGLTH